MIPNLKTENEKFSKMLYDSPNIESIKKYITPNTYKKYCEHKLSAKDVLRKTISLHYKKMKIKSRKEISWVII